MTVKVRRDNAGTSIPEAAETGLRCPAIARRFVIVVALGFFAASCAATAGNLDEPLPVLASVAFLLPLLTLQLLHSAPAARRRRQPWWPWSLVAHGLLTYLPHVVFRGPWVGIPGSFEASLLLTLPTPRSWAASGCAAAFQFPVAVAVGETPSQAAAAVVSVIVGGLVIYGVARLADLAEALHAARVELARDAVDRERVRFARDLHDVCGYSLSAVALKCELIHGLVRTDPHRAQAELVDTQLTVRQALSEVRALSTGYRELSFDKEVAAVVSLLEMAGTKVETDLSVVSWSPEIDRLFVTVVREGFTNALRHSKARHCSIAVQQSPDGPGPGAVTLTMANDGACAAGADVGRADAPGGGNGLRNLAERSAELDGRLTAESDRAGWFRLTVTVPAVSRAAARGGPSVRR
ncbi:histidine kinase [Streptomyces sp. HD1123-B1]|uniref:sensor histidine kinase n=1 Tax=Streptomyces huangiella TaxID=3228804 RepID=UPI003D7DD9B3